MSGVGGSRTSTRPEESDSFDETQARCSIQKRISALFVQEEDQACILGQPTGARDNEPDIRRSAFLDEILHVRALNFYFEKFILHLC